MYTLTWSELNLEFNGLPTVKTNNDNLILSLLCDTSIVKWAMYRRVLHITSQLDKKLSKPIAEYKHSGFTFNNPDDFIRHINIMLREYKNLIGGIEEMDYFTYKQSKAIKLSMSNVLKKMLKLEAIAIKESNKNKKKIDDSEMINLIMHNNMVALQTKDSN